MSVFNKTRDALIVDTVKNVFQRRSSEVFKPDVQEFGTIQKYMLHCQYSVTCCTCWLVLSKKVGKDVSSMSGQCSTCFVYDLPHPGVKRDCCGRFCQQLDRLHEACCLQCSRYPLIQAANDEEGGGRLVGQHTWGPKGSGP